MPFSYTVRGVEFGCRNETTVYCREDAEAEVFDVPGEELVPALVIRDRADAVVEEFFSYDGRFWIRDSRTADGDIPFVAKHAAALGLKMTQSLGHDPRKVGEQVCGLLGKIGIAKVRSAKLEDSYDLAKHFVFLPGGGVSTHERTPETERMRKVVSTTRPESLSEARTKLSKKTIAVDGRLYSEVPEPGLVAKRNSPPDWTIRAADYLAANQYEDAYPVSVLDLDKVDALFGLDGRHSPTFSLDVLAPSAFVRPTFRIALMKDAVRVVEHDLSRRMPTEAITLWCRLRDRVEAAGASRLRQPEAFYEDVASDLAALSATGHNVRGMGLALWDSRPVSLEVEARSFSAA
jgi:hypothetical protein